MRKRSGAFFMPHACVVDGRIFNAQQPKLHDVHVLPIDGRKLWQSGMGIRYKVSGFGYQL